MTAWDILATSILLGFNITIILQSLQPPSQEMTRKEKNDCQNFRRSK